MVVLETQTPTLERVVATAESTDFAFFISFRSLCNQLREITAYSKAAREFKIGKHILASDVERGFSEAFALFQETFKDAYENLGNSKLAMPMSHRISAPEKNLQALTDDYGKYYDTHKQTLLIIPGEKITAAHTLRYDATPGEPEPLLALRIKTSADNPTEYFSGPGQISHHESQGSWFHLPLEGLDLDILV